MLKSVLTAAAVTVAAVTLAPSFARSAEKMDCASEMKKSEGMMMKMHDQKKKDMAMKEMGMAKDMMAKKDEKGCMMHMEKAMGMMK